MFLKHLEKKICDGSYRLSKEAEDVVVADPGASIGEEFVADGYSQELPKKLAALPQPEDPIKEAKDGNR